MNIADHYNSYNSLVEAFFDIVEKNPNGICYSQAQISTNDDLSTPRQWKETTNLECRTRVLKITRYLQQIGLHKGAQVAILSNTRPEWLEADFAILACGGVVVSVYQTLLDHDVAYILFDSETKVIFVENQEQLDKVLAIMHRSIEMPGTEDREPTSVKLTIEKIISFEKTEIHPKVVWLGDILQAAPDSLPEVTKEIGRDDLASFVYTSGTTGPPKGVVQTHGNHLSNVRQAINSTVFPDGASLMLFLPLAHSFAKLIGYLGFLTSSQLKFAAIADKNSSAVKPESVTKDIREANANIIPIVPRLLEKMASKIRDTAKVGGVKGSILSLTLASAKKHYQAQLGRERFSFLWLIAFNGTQGIRKKIKRQLFGENFQFAVAGGAKLPIAIAEFFDALEIEILEGYGLTETCVATNVNRLGTKKIGTVGPVIDQDIELKIADDGEISFRGPNITSGYYKRPTATKNSWDEQGWFRTGDLGSIDKDGFLSITGRKKELIVTTAGKKIPPSKVEDIVKKSSYVSQVVAIGDSRAHIGVLLTLESENIKRWAKGQGLNLNDAPHQDTKVKALIQTEIDRANKELASYERIHVFAILPGDFTVENGMLTPTMKVKRNLIIDQYAELIDAIYT